MSVDEQTVRKVAKLSRLAVPDEKVGPMAGEINGILGWIEQLNEVDVEGIRAMASTVEVSLPMREDDLASGETGGGQVANIVANAPKTEENFFVVPKVVD